MSEVKHLTIHTDGLCRVNPGPGGYAAILEYRGKEKIVTGGYRKTTSSRMELMAAIAGLEALTEPCRVSLFSDSEYLVVSMSQARVVRWRDNGWMRNEKEKAENPDLWDRLLRLCENHEVDFAWEQGHAGNAYNERCDKLAREASHTEEPLIDEGYESRDESSPNTAPLLAGVLDDDEEESGRSRQVRSGLGSNAASRRKDAIFRAVEEHLTDLGPDVIEVMESDPDAELRGLGAWAIGRLGYRAVYPNLVRGLQDASESRRTWSAWALGELGDESATQELRRAIAREKVDNRRRGWHAHNTIERQRFT